ncbi:uncharacterized protein LOC135210479 [Macrobrachium nipponense]|uniref:uncharacterized protein LOC135210479 n=1 Tax=Macrobrachium nipponense TaxID=159736 RepID=UPI0030C7EE35
MADIDCKVDRKCVACTFKEQQRFSLLGSCESEVRNVYFVAYQKLLGELYFMGYGSYYIRKEGEQWVWVDDVKNETIARMEAAKPNYPMGRRVWHLERPVCGQEPNQKRILLLTPCAENEFTCDDGSCVAHHKRCDLKYDCRDNSDEADCMLIDHPEGYQKHLPPRSNLGEDLSLLVVLSMRVSTMAVKTMEMAVDVTFELTLTWKDNRLQYLNLKVNDTLNVLPLEAMRTLWTPDVTFVNAIGNHHTYVDEYTSMMINRSSEFKTRDETAPAEGVLDAPQDLVGAQVLPHVRFGGVIGHQLGGESISGVLREFCQLCFIFYDCIGGLKVGYEAIGEYSEALIKIPLSRLAGYAILNIYIPTLVLLAISYMSLFVRTDMFDTRMMAALTVQLVIATLFSQVSQSLPKTSYFKMVDVWFLFCIAITFIVILFHGIIDSILYPSSGKISSIIQVGAAAWLGQGSASKPNSASQKNEGDFMVRISKIVVLALFVLFNIGMNGTTKRSTVDEALNLRAHLIGLWFRGASVPFISKRTGFSISSVYRWIKRWQEEGHLHSRAKIANDGHHRFPPNGNLTGYPEMCAACMLKIYLAIVFLLQEADALQRFTASVTLMEEASEAVRAVLEASDIKDRSVTIITDGSSYVTTTFKFLSTSCVGSRDDVTPSLGARCSGKAKIDDVTASVLALLRIAVHSASLLVNG